jgi:V-type H+-transporting ATPase proteolipid subunit
MGVASAIVFANLGSAYGTAKAGVGLASMGVMNPDAVMKNIIPVVMAGILGIYGLILSVIVVQAIKPEPDYVGRQGFAHLGAGLSTGLSALAAGFAIGITGDAGVRAVGQQPKLFVSMVVCLIFAETLALYGLIVGIVLSQASAAKCQM